MQKILERPLEVWMILCYWKTFLVPNFNYSLSAAQDTRLEKSLLLKSFEKCSVSRMMEAFVDPAKVEMMDFDGN